MPALACVLIYGLLTVTASAMVFARAKSKRSLIKIATGYFQCTPLRDEWARACGGISWLLGDFRCLGLLKAYRLTLPRDVGEAYRSYIAMSRAAYISIAFLFGFALTAYRIFD